MALSHPSHNKFAAANQVTFLDMVQLCQDQSELRLFLMKSGLLGDFSGQCEQYKEGNVTLVKDKDSHVWRCTLKKCRKRIRYVLFLYL